MPEDKMKKIWDRLIILFYGFWRKEEEKPSPKQSPIRDQDLYNFRRAILDKLDWYFDILKRMKKGDREAYNLYSRIGASVMSNDILVEGARSGGLPSWWINNRPTFGAFFMVTDRVAGRPDGDGDFIYPAFIYFTKYKASKAPPMIERASGDVYLVTAYWDRKTNKGSGYPTQFAINIDKDNNVRALRHRIDNPQTINVKTRSGTARRGSKFKVPNKKWGIDDFFVEWASDHDKSVNDYLVSLFLIAANLCVVQKMEMTRIKVMKGKNAAVFSIDVLRTPYFFKDRDMTVLVNGKRKPIFHFVRTHKRVGAGGNETFVRSHFRGEREFKWNDYAVNITVPGWHHADFTDLDIGARDAPADEPLPVGMVDEVGIANWITSSEGAGKGRHRRHVMRGAQK
jgi:hypothetical protein